MLLRLGRSLLGRLAGLLLLLRLILFGAFTNDRIASRPGDHNRERHRSNHEDNGGHGRRFTQECARSALAKCCLGAAATEGAGPVRVLGLLKQHDENQKYTDDHMQNNQ